MVSQMDYNSRLRLAVCFFRLKTMTDSEDDYTDDSETHRSSDSGKQIEKGTFTTDKKPVLFHPGMLQDIMSEVSEIWLNSVAL